MDIIDVVKGLISDISLSSEVDKVNVIGEMVTIYTCNTLYLRKGHEFKIDDNIYTVNSIVLNESITFANIHNTTIEEGSFFTVNAPFFKHGTVTAADNELIDIQDSRKKMPLVYLYEIVRQQNIHDPLSVIQTKASLRLFFLDEANFMNWTTNDHYTEVIRPIHNLVEGFRKAIKKSTLVLELERDTTINHAKFGEFIKNGHTKNLFSDELSGVEMQFDLEVKKKNVCTPCNMRLKRK